MLNAPSHAGLQTTPPRRDKVNPSFAHAISLRCPSSSRRCPNDIDTLPHHATLTVLTENKCAPTSNIHPTWAPAVTSIQDTTPICHPHQAFLMSCRAALPTLLMRLRNISNSSCAALPRAAALTHRLRKAPMVAAERVRGSPAGGHAMRICESACGRPGPKTDSSGTPSVDPSGTCDVTAVSMTNLPLK